MTQGYISDDLVYIPILRNASNTYRKFFEEKGWDLISLDEIRVRPNLKLFGFIQDPNIRHTKGIAMWFAMTDNDDYLHTEDEKLALMMCSGAYDAHSYPISHMINDLINRVHWIPIDMAVDSNVLLNRYLEDNGSDVRIEPFTRENIASYRSTQNYVRIQNIKEKYYSILEPGLYDLLDQDRKVYQKSKDMYGNFVLGNR